MKLKSLWPRWSFLMRQKLNGKSHVKRHNKIQDRECLLNINENIQRRNEGVEPMLEAIGLHCIEMIAKILSPFMFLFLLFFSAQTQVAQLYNVGETELRYYAIFAFSMIFWKVVTNILAINAQETIYGWKLYDFLSYQKYRFMNRGKNWALHSDLVDESIMESMQTLDVICFSSQYYFSMTLFCCGMSLNVFSSMILLRSDGYHFLGDPILPVITLFTAIFCQLFKRILVKLLSVPIDNLQWYGLWVINHIQGAVDDIIAAKLAIGEGRQEDLERERMELEALNNSSFRHRFLERNRPWILEHLVELIPRDELAMPGPNGRPLAEYIRDVFSTLVSLGEGARRPEDRSDISSDEGDDYVLEFRKNWDRSPLMGTNLTIAKMWVIKARKRRAFNAVVAATFLKNRKEVCNSCSRTENMCSYLRVFLGRNDKPDPYALDVLIRSFEEEYSEQESDTVLWKSFFQSKAKYVTLCNYCVDRNNKEIAIRRPGADRITRPGDISSDDDDDDDGIVTCFDPLIVPRASSEGKMYVKWLNAARSKLGGKFPRPGSKRQTELYIQKLRDRKLSERKIQLNKRIRQEDKVDGSVVKSEESLGKINLTEKSSLIVKNWLQQAKVSSMSRYDKRGDEMREQLQNILDQIQAVDDWFFGRETRMKGIDLKKLGSQIYEEKAVRELDMKTEIENIKIEMDNYIKQIEENIKKKQKKMKLELSDLLYNFRVEMEIRSRELNRALEDMKSRHSKEEQKTRTAEGAVSSSMLDRQKEEIIGLNEKMAEEIDSSKQKWNNVVVESQRNFERDERILQRNITEKVRESNCKIKIIEDKNRKEFEVQETKWRVEASHWIMSGGRKVERKQREDRNSILNRKGGKNKRHK